jgi:hypothetical protein
MILFLLGSFVSIKEVRNGYKGGAGHVFFAKYSFDLSYIFIKKNPIFLYNFCQNWLDTALNDYLLPIQVTFLSRLSLPSRSPKQQTVE